MLQRQEVLQRCNPDNCRTAGGFRICGDKCVLLWGKRAREMEDLGRLENNIVTGGNTALLVAKMVFICLKNLGYNVIHLTRVRSVERNHRTRKYQF